MAGAAVLYERCTHRQPHPATAAVPGIIPATLPDRPHLYAPHGCGSAGGSKDGREPAQPRFHQKTKLYQLVRDNLDEFLRVYGRRIAATYGPLRPEVEKSFRAILKCGVPEEGFATFQCPDCHHAAAGAGIYLRERRLLGWWERRRRRGWRSSSASGNTWCARRSPRRALPQSTRWRGW